MTLRQKIWHWGGYLSGRILQKSFTTFKASKRLIHETIPTQTIACINQSKIIQHLKEAANPTYKAKQRFYCAVVSLGHIYFIPFPASSSTHYQPTSSENLFSGRPTWKQLENYFLKINYGKHIRRKIQATFSYEKDKLG